MWSDRHRGLRLALVALVLVGLGALYTWFAVHVPIGWKECLADPVANDGRELVLPLYKVTKVLDDDHYLVAKTVRRVLVVGSSEGLARGDTVSVIGDFDAEQTAVIARQREVHRYRPHKQAMGVLGLFVAGVAGVRAFRWRAGRLEAR